MKLRMYPPCELNAEIIEKPGKLPDLKLRFYSISQKLEALTVQVTNNDGTVILDTVVLVVSPKNGKITLSRRLEPIELDCDKKKVEKRSVGV